MFVSINPLLLLITFSAAFAMIASIQQTMAIEIPGTLGQCLQEIKPRVCDPNNVLSEDERNKLNETLVRVEESTKREGYPLKIKTKNCGQHGITMPVIQLKATSEDIDTLHAQLNELLQEYTDAHPCMRIAFVVLNADTDKVENRRFLTVVNWNVNVKPIEIVGLYNKETPLVTKAEYGHALINIAEKFLIMASNRLNVPFIEAPMVTAENNIQPLDNPQQNAEQQGAGTEPN